MVQRLYFEEYIEPDQMTKLARNAKNTITEQLKIKYSLIVIKWIAHETNKIDSCFQ